MRGHRGHGRAGGAEPRAVPSQPCLTWALRARSYLSRAEQSLALQGAGSSSQGAVRAQGWGVSCWERYLGRNNK